MSASIDDCEEIRRRRDLERTFEEEVEHRLSALDDNGIPMAPRSAGSSSPRQVRSCCA